MENLTLFLFVEIYFIYFFLLPSQQFSFQILSGSCAAD